jgi:hypothetical protein
MGSVLAFTVTTMFFVSGCKHGHDRHRGPSSVNSVVGSWKMNDGTGGLTFWNFNADGTVIEYNDPGFSSQHLNGTYRQDGLNVSGPFTNPGVGDGEIVCTVSNDGKSMQMDFIEHWHKPFKHVPLTGTKL